MDAMLNVLCSAGADEEEARRAYGSIHTYTIGFTALAASRAKWRPSEGHDVTSRLAAELASFTTTKNFATGLGYLLNGIQRETSIGPAEPSSRAGP
jgi:hypothetical protein